MPRALMFGVLSPWLGGWYFGGILTGIVRGAARADAGVIAMQTLDAGTDALEVEEPPEPGEPVALERVDGYIVIIKAASPRHLAIIQNAGKPVVVVGHRFPDLSCPVVLSDNRSGITEAVTHLIQHGHRRIAFAGYLGADDIRERYDAYRDTLRAHGITHDPRLLFEAAENQRRAGGAVAEEMIAAGLPSTAVIAGTDANALGIIETLTSAGYRVPRDQAVIGFDDLRVGAHARPPLTTVRQSFETLGNTAVTALLDQLAGDGCSTSHHVPTSLVVRESCGCSHGTGMVVTTANGAVEGERVVGEPPDADVPGGNAPTAEPVRTLAARIAAESDGAPVGRVAERIESAIVELLQAQGRTQGDDASYLQATVATQFEVSMELLRSHEEDPQTLRWLARTSADAGCLGLWSSDPSSAGPYTTLDIAGRFFRDGQPRPELEAAVHVGSFPPAALLEVAQARHDELVMVVPVKVNASNWGLLAVVDAVEDRVGTGREPVNQWGALLAVALDHQAVMWELRRQEDRLRIAALYDDLTGLPNRTLFLDRLRQAIRRGKRGTDQRFGVLFLDLDGFKVINDSMGHSVGDKLLVQVAERLEGVLRESDTAARYGGDEFLVLLDVIEDPHTPTAVAERLQAALARPFDLDGHDVVVSASIGIAVSSPRYQDAEDLLRDADIAMYWAKTRGKGAHAIFDVKMHAQAVSRLQIETELRRALDRRELALAYQPILHLPSDRILAFEALLRWRHPARGLLLPGEFLPVAEETGLIVPFGRWVLEESCRQLATWRRGGHADLWMSVNVSDRQFWDDAFIDDLAACLHRNRLEGRSLAIEVTEGVIMRDVDRARKILEDLHTLDCRLLIDDFGTGYSSLEVLHHLPIDALKIDRSFVSRLGLDVRTGELVSTIVLMGGNLNVELIAEGIESRHQRERLVQLGCNLGQGYLYARAVPAMRAGELLAAPELPH